MSNKLLAAFLGALAAFVTGFVIWGVLHLNTAFASNFRDPEAVAAAINANAPADGFYFLPSLTDADGNMLESQPYIAAVKAGPYAMVSVRKGGANMESVQPLLIGFLIEFLAAFLAVHLLGMLRAEFGFFCRALTVTGLGAFAALVDPLLNWNFLFDATGMSFLTAATHVVTWFVAGLVIAAVAKRPA